MPEASKANPASRAHDRHSARFRKRPQRGSPNAAARNDGPARPPRIACTTRRPDDVPADASTARRCAVVRRTLDSDPARIRCAPPQARLPTQKTRELEHSMSTRGNSFPGSRNRDIIPRRDAAEQPGASRMHEQPRCGGCSSRMLVNCCSILLATRGRNSVVECQLPKTIGRYIPFRKTAFLA